MVRKLSLWILLGALLAGAQTKVDVERQGRGTGFLAPPFSNPLRTGPSLPSMCVPGELYFLTTAPAGGNIHVCHTSGSWAPQGSAGQANVTVRSGGDLVGTRPEANFVAGTGVLEFLVDTGSAIDIHHAVDTAMVMTKPTHQSGSTLLCESAATTPNVYECTMTPTLTSYQSGMVLYWKPDSGSVGGDLTLNIDALGAKPIRLADGESIPRAQDILAGQVYPISYDGTQFRLFPVLVPEAYETTAALQSGAALFCESVGTLDSAYSCSLSPGLGAYQKGMRLYWRPDVDANGGSLTLDVDSLGPRAVTLSDGVTVPAAEQLVGGELYLLWYDGSQFRVVEPAKKELLHASDVRDGSLLLCESSETVGASFACGLNPPLDAYQRGLLLHWVPDIAASGAIVLNVDSHGAKSIKLADGVTNPAEGELQAGQMYPIWFDGVQFRLGIEAQVRNDIAPRPDCDAGLRGMLWFLPGESGLADEFAVCAKDSTDTYLWRLIY